MKNRTSIYLIVAICLLVGFLHFLLGPDYQGPFRNFTRGYLINILLPFNLYLLLQISFRKLLSVNKSRIAAVILIFSFGTFVEILQLNKIEFLGTTYDPLDLLMYAAGIGLGIIMDLTIITTLEKAKE